MSGAGPRYERIAISLVASGLGGALLYPLARVAGLSGPVAALVAVAVAAVAAVWSSRRLPAVLDGAARRAPLLAVALLVLGLASAAATGRLAVFMGDEGRVEKSVYPFDEFFAHHSCLSAYFRAAVFQERGVRNVYLRTLYEGPEGEPKPIGNLAIDVFLYPPPFLILPRLALLASRSFPAWRAAWFAIEGGMILLALLATARWLGGRQAIAAGLLAPLVWLSIPTQLTLQIGNFHPFAVAISVLAMLAFERERHALGGALLASGIVCKIFPGVLLLFLLFRRRWRSAAWTAGFAFGYVVLAIAVLGLAPFQAFWSYHLPRLSSGAAFETLFVHPDVVACNHAAFAIVQKLGLLGVPGMSSRVAELGSWVYGAALVGAAALAARVGPERSSNVLVWLALLQLGALRSPFVPDVYAQFTLLWILTVLLALGGSRRATWLGAVGIVLANAVVPTVPLMPVRWLVALTLTHQLAFMVLCGWIVVRGGRRLAGGLPARSN